MAKFNISWLVKKNPDWIVAELTEVPLGTEYKEVSINRTNKWGELFPGFDDLQPGRDVEGEIWQSGQGKWYLFAPKPQTTQGGAYSANKGGYTAKTNQIKQAIKQAQERKEESIGKTLDRKEESIRLSAAQRDAVLIVNTLLGKGEEPWEDGAIKEAIIEWRNWFLLDDEFNNPPPF